MNYMCMHMVKYSRVGLNASNVESVFPFVYPTWAVHAHHIPQKQKFLWSQYIVG